MDEHGANLLGIDGTHDDELTANAALLQVQREEEALAQDPHRHLIASQQPPSPSLAPRRNHHPSIRLYASPADTYDVNPVNCWAMD